MATLIFTKALKEKWLKALKGGKYKHAMSVLRNDAGHCCLGVLAEIHPRLGISDIGGCLLDGDDLGGLTYNPFELLLGRDTMVSLYRANDDFGVDSYEPVIKLIEKLPTVK